MTLPSSGALQFSAINTELCLPSNTTLGLNDNGARALAAKPTPASQIAASDFYGKTGSTIAKYIAVAHNDSPYLSVYAFYEGFGFGPKLADPSTLPYNDGKCVDIRSDKSVVIVGHNDGGAGYPDFFSAYPLSCNGLGAKYAAPAGILPDRAYGVRFSPNGSYVAIGKNDSPRVLVYPWSSGFGTKYADPATLPEGSVWSIAFSASGSTVVASHSYGDHISAYPWNYTTGFGARYANPITVGTAFGVAFGG